MSGRWACFTVLLVAGCQSALSRWGHPTDCLPACPVGGPTAGVHATCPSHGPQVPCSPAPCAPKPQVEVCQGGKVEVNVPRQKVIVPRRPTAAAQTAVQTQAVEQQQIVQTRQVLLVPQQVLVPFVQTTTTGPIRVGAQETQVLNLATVTNATAQSAAINTAAGGVALTPAQMNGALTAGGQAASPQAMAECLAQLRQAEQRIQELTAIAGRLSAQVEALSKPAKECHGLPLPPIK